MSGVDLVPMFGLGVQEKSRVSTAQKRVNLYYELQQDPDRTRMVAYKTPGLAAPFVDFGDTPIRGAIWPPTSDFKYYVHRGTFWQVNNAGVATSRGTIGTTSGRVIMAENGTQIMLVDGVAGWIYNMSTLAFTQIVDPSFPNGARNCAWSDGYFLAELGNLWYVSDHDDGTSWPGDFAAAESNPDGIVRTIVDHQNVHLFGAQSLEFWENTGNADFPFERIAGSTQEWGCAAFSSIAKFDDSLAFLAQNRLGQVIAATVRGLRIERISNHDLESKWRKYGSFADAVGGSYMLDGHPMYVVSFPIGGETFLYDGSTQAWTQLVSYGLTRHRGDLYLTYLGRNFVTDYATGKVYELSPESFSDNGDPIRWEIVGRHIFDGKKKMGIDAFVLDCETGVGLATGQGEDPQVMLRISHDGGRTWGAERWRSMGKLGIYGGRGPYWRKCGRARDFTFWIAGSDPVKTAIMGAGIQLRAVKGSS